MYTMAAFDMSSETIILNMPKNKSLSYLGKGNPLRYFVSRNDDKIIYYETNWARHELIIQSATIMQWYVHIVLNLNCFTSWYISTPNISSFFSNEYICTKPLAQLVKLHLNGILRYLDIPSRVVGNWITILTATFCCWYCCNCCFYFCYYYCHGSQPRNIIDNHGSRQSHGSRLNYF